MSNKNSYKNPFDDDENLIDENDDDDVIPDEQAFDLLLDDNTKKSRIQALISVGTPIPKAKRPALFMQVPLNLLKIEKTYQRECCIKPEFQDKFDAALAEAITLSYRDGLLWIVNGQHRARAAATAGVDTILAIIIFCDTIQEEAKLFLELNKDTTPIKLREEFNAAVTAQEPTAVAIKHIVCDQYHMNIGTNRNSNFTALNAVYAIIHDNNDDPDILAWSMDVLNVTGWAMPSTHISEVLRALGCLYMHTGTPNNKFDLDEAKTRLQMVFVQHSLSDIRKAADIKFSKNYEEKRSRMKKLFFDIAEGTINNADIDDILTTTI